MKLALWIIRRPETITIVLGILALLIGGHYSPDLYSLPYLLGKTADRAPIALVALTMTLVIAAGQIDLSVASGTVLCSVVAGLAFRHGHGLPFVIATALLTGLALGAFNGLLVGYLRLPALVVTLGTLAGYRGLAQVLIGNDTVRDLPENFCDLYLATLGPPRFAIPYPILVLFAAAAILAFLLAKTTFGRRLVVVGTNEHAARYAAINVPLVKLAAFMLSGLFMGLGAVLLMSQNGFVDHLQLRGDELFAITAVVLGGTAITGGRGTVLGTLLALFLLVIVDSATGINGVIPAYRLAILGALLLSAVLLSNLTAKLKTR